MALEEVTHRHAPAIAIRHGKLVEPSGKRPLRRGLVLSCDGSSQPASVHLDAQSPAVLSAFPDGAPRHGDKVSGRWARAPRPCTSPRCRAIYLVGEGRFELPASTSRTWRANQAALLPGERPHATRPAPRRHGPIRRCRRLPVAPVSTRLRPPRWARWAPGSGCRAGGPRRRCHRPGWSWRRGAAGGWAISSAPNSLMRVIGLSIAIFVNVTRQHATRALDALFVPGPGQAVLDELTQHRGDRRRVVSMGQT